MVEDPRHTWIEKFKLEKLPFLGLNRVGLKLVILLGLKNKWVVLGPVKAWKSNSDLQLLYQLLWLKWEGRISWKTWWNKTKANNFFFLQQYVYMQDCHTKRKTTIMLFSISELSKHYQASRNYLKKKTQIPKFFFSTTYWAPINLT